MDRTELRAQIEGASDRIGEALVLLESIAAGTAHSEAQDLVGLLGKVDRKMFEYRGSLYQHQKI
jgi:hypothetical protein